MRSRRWTGSSGTVVERRSSTIRGSLRTAILRRGESSIGPAARRRCPWDGSGRSDASLTGGTVRYDLASAEVAEWQTRRSQTPLRATSCGFESHLRYHAGDVAAGPAGQAGHEVRSVERSPDRPTALLPISHLVRLSIYWLGLVAVINGIGIILQERIKTIVPDPDVQYTTLGIVQVVGIVVAIVVQPTIGSISDYTISRFGRRKPYIVIGTTLNLVFLVGLATSNTVLAVAAFVTLLQLSSNVAQGAFQGYIPDLVPEAQVGLASAMVGMFTVLGAVIGTALASIGLANGDFFVPTVLLGAIQFGTMLLLIRLDEGPPGKRRHGLGWRSMAALAW